MGNRIRRVHRSERYSVSKDVLAQRLGEARAQARQFQAEGQETAKRAEYVIRRQLQAIHRLSTVLDSRLHRFVSAVRRFMGWDELPHEFLQQMKAMLEGPKKEDRPTQPEDVQQHLTDGEEEEQELRRLEAEKLTPEEGQARQVLAIKLPRKMEMGAQPAPHEALRDALNAGIRNAKLHRALDSKGKPIEGKPIEPIEPID